MKRATAKSPSKPVRKYKHIFWHKGREVWQAVRRGFAQVPVSPDQDDVAKMAAALWKVSVTELKLATQTQEDTNPRQEYSYVTWHCSSKVWTVQDKGVYIGSSQDLHTAVGIACRHFGCSPEDLRKESTKFHESNAPNDCVRFGLLWKIYRGSKRDDPWLPLDVSNLWSEQCSDFLSRSDIDGLQIPFVCCKFPAQRVAVIEAFEDAPGSTAVERVYNTLVCAAEVISHQAHPAEECRHIGRNNMHHASIAVILDKSLGVLRKLPDAEKSTRPTVKQRLAQRSSIPVMKHNTKRGRTRPPHSKQDQGKNGKVLDMGKDASRYIVEPLSAKLKERISSWIAFGQALRKVATPKTLKEWGQATQTIQKVIRGDRKNGSLPVHGLSGNYRGLWVMRGLLLVRMRREGLQRLTGTERMSGTHMQSMFPDQKDRVKKLSGGRLTRKLDDIFSSAQYDGAPELFTMWACLFNDRVIGATPLAWLQEHREVLVRAFTSYCKKHGFPPHPGVLVEEARKRISSK